MASVWDFCVLEPSQSDLIEDIEKSFERNYFGCPSSSGALSLDRLKIDTKKTLTPLRSGIDGLQVSLFNAESSCSNFMGELDTILHTLGEISNFHADVTGRTNSLMTNCENLLEQQVNKAD
jgi:hypothetical protein